MAKKQPTRQPAKKPRAKPAAPAPADPSRGSTTALTDAQRAQVWVLREEGMSLRQIAKEVRCNARTVMRILEEDPTRHAALVTEQKEERATLWRTMENRSLVALLDAVDEAGETIKRVRKKGYKVTDRDRERVVILRSLMTPLRMAADSATARSQLLTGEPTSIAQVGGILDPERMSPQEIIALARTHGMVDQLPPRLRELAGTVDPAPVDLPNP